MADQKTADAGISGLVKTFYDKKLIETLKPMTFLYQAGEKRPIPKGTGKTIEFTGYRKINPITSNSNELSSTQSYISAFTISATVIQRHTYLQFSDLLKTTSIDPNVMEAVNELADAGARTVEFYIRGEVVGKFGNANRSSTANNGINTALNSHQGDILGNSAQRTFHFYSQFPMLHNKARLSSSGADVAVMAGSAFTISQVRHATTFLRGRDARPFEDGRYLAFAHPQTIDSIMADPAFKNWMEHQNAGKMLNFEIGEVMGVRFLMSTMALRFVYSAAPLTTASGAMNFTFITGKGAFAVTEISGKQSGSRGFEVIVKNPGPNNTNDPANLISTVAIKTTMAAAVLNKSAGVVIVSTDKVVSGGV